MIKLKIGDNFLITSNNDLNHEYFITYMMGCFEGHNKTAIGLDIFGHNNKTSYEVNLYDGFDDYIKVINSMLIGVNSFIRGISENFRGLG